jgi:16S rRNA (uracil1498-N3)-methyltransferase
MRTIRIYEPGTYKIGDILELSPQASQHVVTVLRMQPGEAITLFCGDNYEYAAIIKAVQKKKALVEIEAMSLVNRESPRPIHLGQAVSKGERMEMVIQKAVELGCASITPLITSRCVVRLDVERWAKKQAQWQAIAIAACEQSGRNQIPTIYPPCDLDDYLEQCQADIKLVLDPKASSTWRNFMGDGSIAVLIGPEGGLSEEEIQLAKALNFQGVSLGPRILRTETAAIAMISILQAMGGDLA